MPTAIASVWQQHKVAKEKNRKLSQTHNCKDEHFRNHKEKLLSPPETGERFWENPNKKVESVEE